VLPGRLARAAVRELDTADVPSCTVPKLATCVLSCCFGDFTRS
jgi:hypothetical protein